MSCGNCLGWPGRGRGWLGLDCLCVCDRALPCYSGPLGGRVEWVASLRRVARHGGALAHHAPDSVLLADALRRAGLTMQLRVVQSCDMASVVSDKQLFTAGANLCGQYSVIASSEAHQHFVLLSPVEYFALWGPPSISRLWPP